MISRGDLIFEMEKGTKWNTVRHFTKGVSSLPACIHCIIEEGWRGSFTAQQSSVMMYVLKALKIAAFFFAENSAASRVCLGTAHRAEGKCPSQLCSLHPPHLYDIILRLIL